MKRVQKDNGAVNPSTPQREAPLSGCIQMSLNPDNELDKDLEPDGSGVFGP